MRILIVEDDPAHQALLKKLLGKYGDCDIAPDGHEGLEMAQAAMVAETPYDLVTIDMSMPKRGGLSLLEEIRGREELFGVSHDRASKIVFITSDGDKKKVLQAFRQQADGYVLKPITGAKIDEALERTGLLGRPETRNEE